MAAKAVMLGTLENDVATSVAILDRLPADERADWLERLDRGTYRFELGAGLARRSDALTDQGAEIAAKIRQAVGRAFPDNGSVDPRRWQASAGPSDA